MTNNNYHYDDLMAKAREYGKAQAAGADALPMLACSVAETASTGALSDTKDANGMDDIARVYAGFVAACSKKAVHEHTDGGVKANTSKLRQIKRAAEKPTCDFYGHVMPRVIATRLNLAKEGVKVKAAYAAYVDAAREQIKQDDNLSDDQIADAVRKPEPADKSVVKELNAIQKRMEGLISGDCGVRFAESDFIEAYEKVRECGNILEMVDAKARKRAEFEMLAAELAEFGAD